MGTRRFARGGAAALTVSSSFLSCSTDETDVSSGRSAPSSAPSSGVVEAQVHRRLGELRSRFVTMQPRRDLLIRGAPSSISHRAVIREGVVTSFVPDGTGVEALIPPRLRMTVPRSATVRLPALAGGAVEVRDDGSNIAIAFRLQGTRDATLNTDDGIGL